MNKHEERLQQFADELVKKIEANEAPWQKGWVSGLGDVLPVNHQGKPYRGNNLFELMMTAQAKGYSDNRWYTFNNAKDYGGYVRKGEKGTVITFYSRTKTENKKDEQGNTIFDKDGNPAKITVALEKPVITTAVVFNAEQIEGLPPRVIKTPMSEWERHEKAESIVRGIQSQGVTIEHKLGDKAYYRPSSDTIVMPERGQFPTADTYYATLLHEIGHSTGHESRLNRDLSGSFGSESYAKEELRAEIASMIVGEQLQIGYDPSQHHAYLQSWAKVIKEDPKEIFKAVKEADEISKFVLGLGQDIGINQREKTVSNTITSENNTEPTLEQRLIKQSAFEKAIDKVVSGYTPSYYVRLGKTPEVLQMLGLPNVNVSIKGATIEKIMGYHLGIDENKHSHLHNLTPKTLKQLPSQLYDPIAVFKSSDKSTNPDGYVILTELKEKDINTGMDKSVIASIKISSDGKNIDITSVYGRQDKQIENAFKNDLLYVNIEKGQQLINTLRLQLPIALHDYANLSGNIKTDKDLSQYISLKNPQESLANSLNVHQKQASENDTRLYLYTSFKDLNDLNKLKEQGIIKFDIQHKVWYAHENNKNEVARWTTRPSVPSYQDEFTSHLRAMGITVEPGHPMFDGKTHRLRNEGSQEKNVMYQAYENPNGVPFARVTNFSRSGVPENWQYPKEHLHILKNIEAVEQAKRATDKNYQAMPTTPIANMDLPKSTTSTVINPSTAAAIEDEKLKKAKADLMASISKMIVSISEVAPPTHNYLSKKQVSANDTVLIIPDSSKLPDGFKHLVMIADTYKQAQFYRETHTDKLILQRGNLAIPQYNTQGELRAFETISYVGGKYALKNADKQGLMTILGKIENGKPIIITEGYATGATLHEYTKQDKPAVVIAFGRGGLMEVAQKLRENYPDSKIYLGADNDHQKPLEIDPATGKAKINQGLEDAKKVANIISNTHVLVPQFNQGDTGKDWNDIYVDKGADEFKRQILEQLNTINRPNQDRAKNIEDKKIIPPTIAVSNEPVAPAQKNTLDLNTIKQNYPGMSENNLNAIQAWREYLPIKYENEPIKAQVALERLETKLADYAKGEVLTLPKPEQQQAESPDKGVSR